MPPLGAASDAVELVGEAYRQYFLYLQLMPLRVVAGLCGGIVAQVCVDLRGEKTVYVENNGVLPVGVGIGIVGESEHTCAVCDVVAYLPLEFQFGAGTEFMAAFAAFGDFIGRGVDTPVGAGLQVVRQR